MFKKICLIFYDFVDRRDFSCFILDIYAILEYYVILLKSDKTRVPISLCDRIVRFA